MGNQQTTDSQHKTIIGNRQITVSYPETDLGKRSVAKQLPENLPADEVHVRVLSDRLNRIGVSHVKHSGRLNTARFLLHFYNKGSGAYPELRKLTGLSDGGVGKLIMSLKKRRLIYTISYKKYGLGANVLELLRNLWGK